MEASTGLRILLTGMHCRTERSDQKKQVEIVDANPEDEEEFQARLGFDFEAEIEPRRLEDFEHAKEC